MQAEALYRYDRSQFIVKNYLTDKFGFKNSPGMRFSTVYVSAGPFKTGEASMEHGFILSTLSGVPWALNTQYHGKRGHTTTTIDCEIKGSQIWRFHDKYINEYLRFAFEYETPKHLRPRKSLLLNVTWRYREKFRTNPEYEMLFEDYMWDKYRGKFLPLSVNYSLQRSTSNNQTENFLRMNRLPVIWFKRRDRRFFDDSPNDRLRWAIWWYWAINEMVHIDIQNKDRALDVLFDTYAMKVSAL